MKQLLKHLGEDWYKYVLELIVITAGILGAYALNNWNDKRKDIEEEQTILRGLKIEFEQNLEELKSDHMYNDLCLNATIELLQKNRQSTPGAVVDSLFGHIVNYATFDPRLGIVNEIIAAGKLSLISDEVLRYRITQWPAELNDLKEDNIIRRDTWVSGLVPTYNKYVSHRNSDQTSIRHDYPRKLRIASLPVPQEQYDQLMASSEFDGALYLYFASQDFVHSNENSIKKFMEETLALINENLIQ